MDAVERRGAVLVPDDAINIQYTSGTTGSPKGATLSHHNILNNGYFVTELLGYTEADRVCLPVPFYHCFGMIMGNLGATSHGSCIVIPAPAFDAEATLRAVEQERCTSLYGVPTMFIAELDHADFASFDLDSLRTGIMAGSPCPVEVMKRVIDRMHMREVAICYGMTETSPVSTQTRADDSLERRVGTVGRPGPHVEVKVVDPETGLTVPRGDPGELCTRGYSVMLGYWEDAERTAEAIDAARWMHTGDLATMDDDGYCNIVGRIKDLVIRGGENVYPREVEEFLLHPPGRRRRAGRGRAGRADGRGAVRLGRAAGRRVRGRGGDPRALPRPYRALQGAALRPVRRLVPHDRDGQDPEVPDARDVDRAARPGAGGGDPQRVAGHDGGPGDAGGPDPTPTAPRRVPPRQPVAAAIRSARPARTAGRGLRRAARTCKYTLRARGAPRAGRPRLRRRDPAHGRAHGHPPLRRGAAAVRPADDAALDAVAPARGRAR